MLQSHEMEGILPKQLNGYYEYKTLFGDIVKEYWVNGKLHREDGPARSYSSGTYYWFLNGKLHRLDGPAIILLDGCKKYYQYGNLHRLDGPAIETKYYIEYWINGREYSKEDYYNIINTYFPQPET